MVTDLITKRTIQGRYTLRPPLAGKLNELVGRRLAVNEPRRKDRAW